MGKGSEDPNVQINKFTWNEVKRHNSKNDLWIVIDGYVYDITKFQKKHPGGTKVVNFYSGQDATVNLIYLVFDNVLIRNKLL
jgi:cytochrome b involved in lipid metabolism